MSLFSTIGTKIMITSGYNGRYLATTEVIDLLTGQQFKMPPLPTAKLSATGGLINGKLVVCGGWDANYKVRDECHSFDNSPPKLLTKLRSSRQGAASVVVESALWVLGGSDGSGLKSTEWIENGKTTDGPPLPEALRYHSAVKVSETTTLVVGGWSANAVDSKKTFFFNKEKGWWFGPDLSQGRRLHSVGVCFDKVTKNKFIVATGGVTVQSRYDRSVEILPYPGCNHWTKGKPTTHLAFVHSVDFDPFLY